MLNEDYKEMLQLLLDEGVDFIVVGAYALAAHGHPRATLDMDIWVRPSTQNAVSVFRALAKFGAPLQGITEKDLEAEGTVFQIGVAPRRIDVLTGISGVKFEEAQRDKVVVEVEGMKLPILSVANLIRNKEATGRLKDMADVQNLRKRNDTD